MSIEEYGGVWVAADPSGSNRFYELGVEWNKNKKGRKIAKEKKEKSSS